MIGRIQKYNDLQDSVDILYSTLVKILCDEMDTYLTSSWKSMCQAEKLFLKYNGTRQTKTNLRRTFLATKQNYDKLLRRTERK